jgi:6-phosphogluconolactonase
MNTAPRAEYPGELRVFADREQLAKAAAELFVNIATESIGARDMFRVALSGGSTPRRVYELLASDAFRRRVDWAHVDIFWGDERYVPAESQDSNYRMTSKALLRHVPVPAANVHPVPTNISPPHAAADAYEDDIRRRFGNSPSMPQFDLVYLGLGANGHTASLFPHSQALRETSRLVVADFVPEVGQWRISMSARLLNHGRTVALLIAGEEKAGVLHEVLLGPRNPERLPAQLIAPEGKLLWLADDAAAALLPAPGRERRSA